MIDARTIREDMKQQNQISCQLPIKLVVSQFPLMVNLSIYLQQLEFEWILQKEVLIVLKQLHSILVECAHRFPVPLHGNEGKKTDKFVLTSAPEQLKVVVTLTGDSITHAVSQT